MFINKDGTSFGCILNLLRGGMTLGVFFFCVNLLNICWTGCPKPRGLSAAMSETLKHDVEYFGPLVWTAERLDSEILSLLPDELETTLQSWIPEGFEVGERLFRTTDAKDVAGFHAACDSAQQTLVLIQSTKGFVFGGYADASWGGTSGYVNAPGCFLFTLTNPHKIAATKFVCITDKYSLYRSSRLSCLFGNDLCVWNGNKSYTSFSRTYSDPTGLGKKVFTGQDEFTLATMEVFEVIKHGQAS